MGKIFCIAIAINAAVSLRNVMLPTPTGIDLAMVFRRSADTTALPTAAIYATTTFIRLVIETLTSSKRRCWISLLRVKRPPLNISERIPAPNDEGTSEDVKQNIAEKLERDEKDKSIPGRGKIDENTVVADDSENLDPCQEFGSESLCE